MPLQVCPNGYFFRFDRLSLKFDEEPLGVRIEAEHVVQQAPHLQVEETFRLTEHRQEIISRPLERTLIAGHRERHFRLDNTLC